MARASKTHVEITCRYCGDVMQRTGSSEDIRIWWGWWFSRHRACYVRARVRLTVKELDNG